MLWFMRNPLDSSISDAPIIHIRDFYGVNGANASSHEPFPHLLRAMRNGFVIFLEGLPELLNAKHRIAAWRSWGILPLYCLFQHHVLFRQVVFRQHLPTPDQVENPE